MVSGQMAGCGTTDRHPYVCAAWCDRVHFIERFSTIRNLGLGLGVLSTRRLIHLYREGAVVHNRPGQMVKLSWFKEFSNMGWFSN